MPARMRIASPTVETRRRWGAPGSKASIAVTNVTSSNGVSATGTRRAKNPGVVGPDAENDTGFEGGIRGGAACSSRDTNLPARSGK
ncbi:MAG: hypothetical protein IPP07_24940 [Holophagales bacterium]|nr:hypothetical protein [Holophagales bacterium]